MASPVVHWEIGANNLSKLTAFYSELFDWDITPAGLEYALVAGAHGGIGGGIMQVREHMPSYVTFYVQVPDLEPALEHALELGAAAVVEPTAIPGGSGRFAMFTDPDGHLVGLLETEG